MRFLFAAIAIAWTMAAQAAAPKPEASSKAVLFERVFGAYARLDPAIVERVRKLPPGTRYHVARTSDRPAEVWFIDTDARHQKPFLPILVRVIDEDGDMRDGGEPDYHDDLYIADWHADGTVDAVIDYQDDDGDGDADQMGIFFFQAHNPYVGKDALCVWWAWDLGDDNLLWYDVHYTYQQPDCQWRTHFGGDEMFVAFVLTSDAARWEPVFENPFLFYDTDRDGESEVVLRVSGRAEQVESIRYSFDADARSSRAVPHHYDFSLTALAPGCTLLEKTSTPGKSDLRLDARQCRTTRIRGIPTGPYLAHDRALAFANETRWARVLLTWDENDLNTDGNYEKDAHLRWEGVIAHPSRNFPQIGGPTCGPFNKRNEIDLAPAGPMRLYFDPADRRIHLRDADEAWIDVDVDFDRKVDMRYAWRDADADGILETQEIDTDGDGTVDLTLRREKPVVEDVPLHHGRIVDAYRPALDAAVTENTLIIDAMRSVLQARDPRSVPDAAEAFYSNKLAGWLPAQRVGERMRASAATARYYGDIVRDRYLVRVLRLAPDAAIAGELQRLRAAGNLKAATDLIRKTFAGALSQPSADHEGPAGKLGGRPGIRLYNRRDLLRTGELVVVTTEQIRKAAPDFDPQRALVVDGRRAFDWRRIPHQVDTAGPGGREELCFLASMDPQTSRTYWLATPPKGEAPPRYPMRTGWAQDWVPPNIGWESTRIAYRAYWGQFDFFGKKVDRLILDSLGSQSYHSEVEWGIDALNVAGTSGLGGLTLYVGDKAYLVQNPEGKGTVEFSRRMLAAGPVRTTIEIVADKVGPYRVVLRCTAVADRQETVIHATVAGPAAEEPMFLAPGFIRLPEEAVLLDSRAGVFAVWGRQTHVIGTIGMGLVFDAEAFGGVIELPAERRVRIAVRPDREISYLLVGDWLRGRTYPRCPTVDNWHAELRDLAVRFRNPPAVEIVPPDATK